LNTSFDFFTPECMFGTVYQNFLEMQDKILKIQKIAREAENLIILAFS